jgi:hypothetical protein
MLMYIKANKAMENTLRILFSTIFILFLYSTAWSLEISLLSGTMLDTETRNRIYAWQLEYGEEVTDHFKYSLSYLNEGHLPNHHRDGDIFQLWFYHMILDQRVSIAAGAGLYYYYDTTRFHEDSPFSDAHGLGQIISLAATWNIETHWLVQLRGNMIHTDDSIDTNMVLIGVGYRFNLPSPGKDDSAGSLDQTKMLNNEVSILLGHSILNSFTSQNSSAWCLEYRRALLRVMDWTLAYLDEGGSSVLHRRGVNTQLWLKRDVVSDKLWFGIGGGLYVFDEKIKRGESIDSKRDSSSGIFSMTGGYRFSPGWDARITWNRIISHNNLDADVILGGFGYSF